MHLAGLVYAQLVVQVEHVKVGLRHLLTLPTSVKVVRMAHSPRTHRSRPAPHTPAPRRRGRRPWPVPAGRGRAGRAVPHPHNSTVCNVNFNVFAIPIELAQSLKMKKISPSVSQPFQMACAPRFRRACLCAASTFPSSRAPRHSFHFRLLHERPLRATSVHPDHVALGTR